MPISLRSQSTTTYTSRTNIPITAPSGIADSDILLAGICTGLNGTPPTPALAGWAAFGTTTLVNGAGFQVRETILWKRAASESGSYTFTHSTASSVGWMGAFPGCIASGTPLSATSNNTGVSGSTSTGTGITTTAANSWLLWLGHDFADTTNNLTPPSGMTEIADLTLLYVANELRASAGATGNRTMTNNSTSGPWAVRMVELLAAPSSGTPNSLVMPRQGLVRAAYW